MDDLDVQGHGGITVGDSVIPQLQRLAHYTKADMSDEHSPLLSQARNISTSDFRSRQGWTHLSLKLLPSTQDFI